MTLLQVADKFPPCVCRYLARKSHGRYPLSVREIAARSGLGKSTVAKLSIARTWKGVSIETVVAFSQACGVDLMRPHRALEFLRRNKRVHIQNADPNQKKFFMRLFRQHG